LKQRLRFSASFEIY